MQRLTVLYDEQCALCRRARRWLERQSQFVPLTFIAASSDAARGLFPSLDHEATLVEPTVVADTGAVFCGAKAWIMCLWALEEYRSMALTMRSPGAWWAAKRFVTSVSRNRRRLALRGGRA